MNYNYLKLLHLIPVMLFLGNIVTGLFWMRFAVKTRNVTTINFTMQSIMRLDKYFTIPGVVIITAAGILSAIYGHLPILRTGWIFWSIIMFSVSGIVFSIKLIPLQKQIYNLTLNKETLNAFDWKNFEKKYSAWDLWGIVALLTPLAAFVMMVLKIPL
jgi:uncharacterized membrane protein